MAVDGTAKKMYTQIDKIRERFGKFIVKHLDIIETVKVQLGSLLSAKMILYSVDFHEIEALQRQGDWDSAGQAMAQAAR